MRELFKNISRLDDKIEELSNEKSEIYYKIGEKLQERFSIPGELEVAQTLENYDLIYFYDRERGRTILGVEFVGTTVVAVNVYEGDYSELEIENFLW